MLVCNGCHRHIKVEEPACPFCGTSIRTVTAPGPRKLGAMVFAVGLSMLGCGDKGEDDATTSTSTGMTTGAQTGSESSSESGESSGAETTDATAEEGGADYGGPSDTTGGDGDGDGDTSTGDTTTGDGDGDGDSGGADYGGAPPPLPPAEH